MILSNGDNCAADKFASKDIAEQKYMMQNGISSTVFQTMLSPAECPECHNTSQPCYPLTSQPCYPHESQPCHPHATQSSYPNASQLKLPLTSQLCYPLRHNYATPMPHNSSYPLTSQLCYPYREIGGQKDYAVFGHCVIRCPLKMYGRIQKTASNCRKKNYIN